MKMARPTTPTLDSILKRKSCTLATAPPAYHPQPWPKNGAVAKAS